MGEEASCIIAALPASVQANFKLNTAASEISKAGMLVILDPPEKITCMPL